MPPVSICTQKEFLIESKLNGFWGVLLLLFDLACCYFGGLLTGVCTCSTPNCMSWAYKMKIVNGMNIAYIHIAYLHTGSHYLIILFNNLFLVNKYLDN